MIIEQLWKSAKNINIGAPTTVATTKSTRITMSFHFPSNAREIATLPKIVHCVRAKELKGKAMLKMMQTKLEEI